MVPHPERVGNLRTEALLGCSRPTKKDTRPPAILGRIRGTSSDFSRDVNEVTLRALSRKTRPCRQVQRWQAEYWRPVECIVCVYLVSAGRGAVSEGRG